MLLQGCNVCEDIQCGGSVGYGGHPDSRGEVTLDSMVMYGPLHSVGAVGCLRRIKNAATVARAVMEVCCNTCDTGNACNAGTFVESCQINSLGHTPSANFSVRVRHSTPAPKLARQCGLYVLSLFYVCNAMQHTEHTMLAGEGATAFAKMMGMEEEDLGTAASRRSHESWVAGQCQPNYYRHFDHDEDSCPPYANPSAWHLQETGAMRGER